MADAAPDADALAWAREQVEQVAAKYDGYAEHEPNPIMASAMQLAARLMRLELCGGTEAALGKRFIGRFEPGFFAEQPAKQPE